MLVFEKIICIFAPHTCLGCGAEEDRLICDGCAQDMAIVPSRCYRCSAVTDDYAVCRACRPQTVLHQVVVYTHYQGVAKELLHHMKYERAQAGIREAASHMASLEGCLPADATLVHIPTATTRVRARGYDHVLLLTRELSRMTGLPRRTFLSRVGQAHQVGSNRTERLRQLQYSFRPVHAAELRGKHIVLVDDVLTTGATLETAARMLRRAGATRVSAIVFAQA